MNKIVSAVLVFVMMLSLAGCGISYDDIKGDWTAKTINGMTIDEYAASLGVDPSQATVNVNITEDDIPDDIKELIEMGLYSEEEAEKKIAVGNGNRERRMIIVKPDITYVGTGDDRKPTVAFEDGKYDEDDLYFYEQALLEAGAEPSSDDDTDSESEETSLEDDDLLAMLEGMN